MLLTDVDGLSVDGISVDDVSDLLLIIGDTPVRRCVEEFATRTSSAGGDRCVFTSHFVFCSMRIVRYRFWFWPLLHVVFFAFTFFCLLPGMCFSGGRGIHLLA